jgi:hypothetical protein
MLNYREQSQELLTFSLNTILLAIKSTSSDYNHCTIFAKTHQ